ncbi:hypothetical protein BLA29_004622, partial [Euroglyphus maynei]
SHSSIGSASDLQNSDDESDTSSSEEEVNESDDDGDSSSQDSKHLDGPLHNDNNDDNDNHNEPFKYGLVKNHQSPNHRVSSSSVLNSAKAKSGPGLNISRIQITHHSINSNQIQQSNNTDDGTSVSNSSLRSDSQKNIDSLDHLIGHVEGHRPLLEDDDEDEMATTKSLITIDDGIVGQPALVFDSENSSKYPVQSSTFTQQPVNVILTTHHQTISHPHPLRIHSDFETLPLSSNTLNNVIHHHHHQHSLDNSSEENDRRLDEEVERSLIPQVIFDQMNNKDLFGSIPFTDKELIVSNQTVQHQKETSTATALLDRNERLISNTTNRFENSFSDLPIINNTISPPSILIGNDNIDSVPKSTTDLFGAVPFETSTKSIKQQQGQIIKIPQLIQAPPPSSSSSLSITTPKTLPTSLSSATNPATTAKQKPTLSTSNVIQTSSSVASTGSSSKLSRNQLQRSNLKIKSKVAKKYEVDESDDEVDGLLDPNESEDLLLDGDDNVDRPLANEPPP